MTRITGILREDRCVHLESISLSFSSNEKCFKKHFRENQSTHFVFNNFFPKNSTVYEIMWKNIVEPEGP
jgi:hypothetical protein